jgi:hypothetical protein
MMEAIKEVGALKTITLGGKRKPKKDPTTEELRHHATIARKCSHLLMRNTLPDYLDQYQVSSV